MRRLSEPEAHRGRVAVIQGEYPEGMRARCGGCEKVFDIADGSLVEIKGRGSQATRIFLCASCLERTNADAA